MKNIIFKADMDLVNDEVMLSISGEGLTINMNTFFGTNSIITFIPKEQIGDIAIALSHLAEDIQRTKDLKDGKAGEELRELTPLEKERVE